MMYLKQNIKFSVVIFLLGMAALAIGYLVGKYVE